MRSLSVNPISFSFALLASALLITDIVLDGNPDEAAIMIFTPYLSDIHIPFGKESTALIQAIPAMAQVAILALILVLGHLDNKYLRFTVTISGILLVVCYFSFPAALQFIASIH